MSALAIVPAPSTPPANSPAVTLYNLEEQLIALAETIDMVVPEREEDFLADFRNALSQAVEKRDAVAKFMAHLESQITFADVEIKRLKDRKAWFEKTLEALEYYVVRTIKTLFGPDAKGKYPKLTGKTSTFGLRACPAVVAVNDESKVPDDYKTLTIKLPARTWNDLLDSLDIEAAGVIRDAIKKAEASIDKRLVKADLDAGVIVPGACLEGDTPETRKHNLVRA